ncbi:MAG: anthranilate synthase component I [Robiginitomaculum sp.]|nr:anthranilate synthase component I [Robiginitomaculum sp.]
MDNLHVDNTTFQNYCKVSSAGEPYLATIKVIDDLTTPVAALLKIGLDQNNIFLLESVKGGETRGRYSVIGLNPDQCFRVLAGKPQISVNNSEFVDIDDSPVVALRNFVQQSDVPVLPDLPPMLSGVFGYIGYDAVNWIENIPLKIGSNLQTPDAVLIRPTLMAVFDSVKQEIILSRRIEPTPSKKQARVWQTVQLELQNLRDKILGQLKVSPVIQSQKPNNRLKPSSNTSKKQFQQMVRKAKSYIKDGDVFQVVLSQRFSVPFTNHPFALYRSLRKSNPSPFLYYMQLPEFCIIGSSPEILVRVRNNKITIRPIAGTRPRGATLAEDEKNELDLLADKKELAEHLMLLDLGRNDAGRVAKSGTVKVTKSFAIERYSKVMHIVSNIEADLATKSDALDALFAGFPHGTVSGAPKIRAMEIISELEQESRGIYAGAIGYFSANGDLDTCIALRTAIIKNEVMHVQAGGGNVLDSDEEAERMETIHKAQALFDAAASAWRFDVTIKSSGEI